MAYLSKISAIVSVNTGDARQQLAGFSGDAAKWAASFENQMNRMNAAASKSFAGVFTEAQQFKRLLKAAFEDGIDTDTIMKTQSFARLGKEFERIAALRQKVAGFSGPAEFIGNAQIDAAAEAFAELNDQLVKTGSFSEDAFKKMQLLVNEAGKAVAGTARDNIRIQGAQDIAEEFSRGGNQTFFDQKIARGAIAQLTAYRTIIGRVKSDHIDLNNLLEKLADLQRQAVLAGTSGQDKYTKDINETTEALNKLIAAQAKAQGMQDLSTPLAVGNQVSQASGGLANERGQALSLGVQQLVYAVDDFMSVSGDMSQRIRAAGNNISQFGAILGQTFGKPLQGLLAGVAISIGAQLGAAVYKWYTAAEDASDVTDALADRERRLTEARERHAEMLERITESLRTAGLSEAQQRELQFGDEAKQAAEAARDTARTTLERGDPELIRLKAVASRLEREIGESQNASEVRRLSSELVGVQRQIDTRSERLLTGQVGFAPDANLRAFAEEVSRLRAEVTRDEDTGTNVNVGQLVRTEQALQQFLAELPQLVGPERDQAILEFLASQRGVGGTPNTLGETAAGAAGALTVREQFGLLEVAEAYADQIPALRRAEMALNSYRDQIDAAYGNLEVPNGTEQGLTQLNAALQEINVALQGDDAEVAAQRLQALGVTIKQFGEQALAAGKDAVAQAEAQDKVAKLQADMARDDIKRRQEAAEFFKSNREGSELEKALEGVRKFSAGGAEMGLSGDALREATRTYLVGQFAGPALQPVDFSAQRARMDLTDTSETSGVAELNRLLRGEDSNTGNQSLQESRKQTEILQQLLKEAQNEDLI